MIERKKPEAELKNYYTVFLQVGLLLSLLILIGIVKMDWVAETPEAIVMEEQEIVEMEEIIQTRQIETPPPPPRQPVPVAVPDDQIIDDVSIDIGGDLNLGGSLDMPPPPPPPADDEPEEDFFVVVENMPELIGGLGALQGQIRYPEMARRAGIEGRVHIQFIVNEQGEVENPVVVRGIGGGADEEALRVVSQAKFTPGMQRGRPVRVQYSLPIFFRLQN